MDLYTVRNNIMKGVSLQELNLRVCFYARVSTDKDEQLHSLSNQISFFNDYISKVPNWEFIGSYIDEGISGTQVKKREEFLRMIEDAKRHKFDLVHAFECRPTTYFPARILQKQGSAFFTDWADWLGKGGSVEERPNGIIKSILKLFETFFENRRFKYSDGITAICSILADECIKRGYPQKKVLLLPNGLRNTYLQSLPIELARAEKGLPQKD